MDSASEDFPYQQSHQAAVDAARQRVLATYQQKVYGLKADADPHDEFIPTPVPILRTGEKHLQPSQNFLEENRRLNEEPEPRISATLDLPVAPRTAIYSTTQLSDSEPQLATSKAHLSSEKPQLTPSQPQVAEPQPQLATAQPQVANAGPHLSEPQPEVAPASEPTPTYSATAPTSALKDTPVNQNAINAEWQEYHSAWQNYYQNYYNEYYSQAAQTYLQTEKLKTTRLASANQRKRRRVKHLLPLFAFLAVVLTVAFLQYNRLIFAPIMAYVSPDTEPVASHIEAVDPTVTQAVPADPRLIIPKLNIDVPVAFAIPYSDVMSAMNHGVAHFMIPGASALPGEVGNLVISGHSAGDIYSSNPYKFIFSGLERLVDGDLIYINYNSVRYTYQMTKREVVEPDNVSALIYETTKPMLTLITCTPLGTSRYRLLITAEQISPSFTSENLSPTLSPTEATLSMPSNEPTFFENILGGLFN